MKKQYIPLAILESLGAEFLEAEARAQDAMSSNSEPPESDLLTMFEGIGIVDVKGKLTNRDSFFNSWFGLVSYNQIRQAAVEAVELGANAILLEVDTPGGAVSGMRDMSNFIETLAVPTVAHTAGTMASAGYFLGASCDHCYADDMAEVGSVGVVMQHMEMTSALKKQGVKVDVIRSGNKKAIGGPYEKLSAENRKYLQDQVDTYAGKFFEFVSEKRGIPMPALGAIKEGGTFIGEEALQAGLVDKIMSFDAALAETINLAAAHVESLKTTDDYSNYQRGNGVFGGTLAQGEEAMPKIISKAAIAALVTAGKNEAPAANATEEEVDVRTEEEILAEETSAETSEPEGKETPPDKEFAELQGKNETLEADLAALTDKFEALEQKMSGMEAAHAEDLKAFNGIITAQINGMRVALSLTSVDMSAFSSQQVLAEYDAVLKTYESSLPVGGVVPNEEGNGKEEKPVVTRESVNAIKNLGF